MFTTLIILTVITIILTLTLFITVDFEYDILRNFGKIKVLLFKIIPIFWAKITIAGEYLNFSNKKNKVIKIKIDLNDAKLQFLNDVGAYLKKKIRLTNVNVMALVCFSNPCFACYLGGFLNIVVSILYAQILAKNTDINLQKNIQTGFRQNELKLKINASLIFSLYDYFWAYLKAYKQQVRRKHEKAHKLQQNRWINRYFKRCHDKFETSNWH